MDDPSPAQATGPASEQCLRLGTPKLFAGLDEAALGEILADCPIRQLAEGENLLVPGQENASAYLLLSGCLKIKLDGRNSQWVCIEPGECVGEMSIIDRKPASAYVVSHEASRVLVIDEARFWHLLGTVPKLVKNLLAMLTERIRARDRLALQRLQERLSIEKEMKIANAIQAELLTTRFDLLARQGVDVHAIMEPVKEVGGDFYDAFFATPDKLFICVGDVVGKGIPAALFMVRSLTQLRMEAMREPLPHTILARVNAGLCQNNDSGMFATLFCAVLDTQTGELAYANGGHPPPLSDPQPGAFGFIPMPEGTILGMFEGADYQAASLTLRPGQSLLAYTDGVTEATDGTGEFFCEERLQTILDGRGGLDAKALTDVVKEAVYAFSGGAHPRDDLTLLALRYLGPGQATRPPPSGKG